MGNGHLSVELESLQHLRHDNIIAVYRVWLDGFNLNLITEPCTFRNIREFTRKHGPVCDVHLKDWCSQILKALSCLHTNSPSITHRSLNCTNIFISEATGQVSIPHSILTISEISFLVLETACILCSAIW